MGAHISLRPDRRFVVEGVESLTGAEATLQGDRLEAFSYLVAGLMTGGQVRVRGCAPDRLATALNPRQRLGEGRSVVSGKRVQVGVDLGGRCVFIKNRQLTRNKIKPY